MMSLSFGIEWILDVVMVGLDRPKTSNGIELLNSRVAWQHSLMMAFTDLYGKDFNTFPTASQYLSPFTFRDFGGLGFWYITDELSEAQREVHETSISDLNNPSCCTS
jgi:hypothetical protein